MNQRLIIGNRLIRLQSIDSTNAYLKELLFSNKNELEGTTVIAETQTNGVGQHGSSWETESGKNLTFSIVLKPNLSVDNQFSISKFISLAIIYFLDEYNVKAKIKWPNDIYIDDDKVGGMLIENTIRDGKIVNSVVGIGLNINQKKFNKKLINPTSLKLKTNKSYLLEEALEQLLNCLDSYYLKFKTQGNASINNEYLQTLYRFNQLSNYEVNGEKIEATIIGVDYSGKLQLNIQNNVKLFDLKEIKFLF